MEALQAGLEKQISEMEFEKSKYVERISNLQDQAKKSSSQTLSLLSGIDLKKRTLFMISSLIT